MSDDEAKEDKEMDEEMQQLMEKEAEEKAAARVSQDDADSSDTEPQPEPTPEPKPEAQVQDDAQEPESEPEPVAPKSAAPKPNADDPMEWAKKKGLNSPEAIARSLQNMEQEFHKRNQNGHPGYQDLSQNNPQPPMPVQPQWQPRPDMGGYPPPQGYGYPPPPQPSRTDVSQQLAKKYGMDPEDVERLMPMVVDAAEAIASRRTSMLERDFINFRKSAMRNEELMTLMQDPAFTDPRVQQEMHKVLDDGRLFQQGNAPYATAFQVAMQNLARKQLQQGAITEPMPNRPPTTAGGGNGSAITTNQITEKVFNSWTEKEQRAYLESNGKRVPRR